MKAAQQQRKSRSVWSICLLASSPISPVAARTSQCAPQYKKAGFLDVYGPGKAGLIQRGDALAAPKGCSGPKHARQSSIVLKTLNAVTSLHDDESQRCEPDGASQNGNQEYDAHQPHGTSAPDFNAYYLRYQSTLRCDIACCQCLSRRGSPPHVRSACAPLLQYRAKKSPPVLESERAEQVCEW